MKKLLIIGAWIASPGLGGCTGDHIPWVHTIDVQQGNVVTQEMVNQLQPGMNKRQVGFIMGTPLINDVFHLDRWDYVYMNTPGKGETELKRVTLFFADDTLEKIAGTMHPEEGASVVVETPQTTVTVPPHAGKKQGLLTRMWDWITFRKAEDHL
jgi:outer membrane protein assembly factor BamE